MKLVTYTMIGDAERKQKIGVLSSGDSEVVDLQCASERIRGKSNTWFCDMVSFLTGRLDARNEAKYLVDNAKSDCLVPLDALKLLAPVPRPTTLRDTMCYEDHYRNCMKAVAMLQGQDPSKITPESLKPPKAWYDIPMFYKSNVNSVVGTDEEVAFPEGEKFKDYELELAFYINKEGKNINARDAMDYVGGFTILNDFSARFTQVKEMDKEFHVGPGISKDFANAMGPCMVTPDAFCYDNAVAIVRVNGEERGRSNTGLFHHSLGDVIEHISNNTTLYPGDVIAMGTVPWGAGLEVLKPLLIGDIVELEIEGIGVLRNKIVPPAIAKIKNRHKIYKRFVCATVGGKSEFVIDDYPDITKSKFVDIWKLTETPACESASASVDQGNAAWGHEAPSGGSVLRFIEINPEFRELPLLSALPPAKRRMFVDILQDVHRSIGTHYIPTEEDMMKHMTLHKTDSINLFVCVGGMATSINDEDEINLNPGDAFIQLSCMHGWNYRGNPPVYVGGLLVDVDPDTITQIEAMPVPTLKSSLGKFKRYVSGTVRSDDKVIGKSRVLIDDYSPNEAAIFDANGKSIGWAGDIWRTFSSKADASGAMDTVTESMNAGPSKNGITFRMVELLPNCQLATNAEVVNYYTVIRGELTAHSDINAITAKGTEHIVQLKSVLTLENKTSENVLFAQFMVDAR